MVFYCTDTKRVRSAVILCSMHMSPKEHGAVDEVVLPFVSGDNEIHISYLPFMAYVSIRIDKARCVSYILNMRATS